MMKKNRFLMGAGNGESWIQLSNISHINTLLLCMASARNF